MILYMSEWMDELQ